jgi:hypothetical protein
LFPFDNWKLEKRADLLLTFAAKSDHFQDQQITFIISHQLL